MKTGIFLFLYCELIATILLFIFHDSLKSKIASAFGLVALHERSYHTAASKFIECNAEIGASYNEVLHAEDIALYGGICALASFKREELKEKVASHTLTHMVPSFLLFECVLLYQVINNPSFKAFLELLPWLRELISDFYSSNYASCLQTLEKVKVRRTVIAGVSSWGID
jgi:COP9 signalosome complex subunit 1